MNSQSINSQLIFGVTISEELSVIMKDLNYEFNGEDNIFFQIGEETIFGVSAPHEEKYNTQEKVLFEYSADFQKQMFSDYMETFEEFLNEVRLLKQEEQIEQDDYDIILDEMHALEKETPHLYLFATHQTVH